MLEGTLCIKSRNDVFRKTPERDLFKIHYSCEGSELDGKRTLTLTLQNKDGSSAESQKRMINGEFSPQLFAQAVDRHFISFRISTLLTEERLSDKNIKTIIDHIDRVLTKQKSVDSTPPVGRLALTGFSKSRIAERLATLSDSKADAMEPGFSGKRGRGMSFESTRSLSDREMDPPSAQRQRGDVIRPVVSRQQWSAEFYRWDRMRGLAKRDRVVYGVMHNSHRGQKAKFKIEFHSFHPVIEVVFPKSEILRLSNDAIRVISEAFLFVLAERLSAQTLDFTELERNIQQAWEHYRSQQMPAWLPDFTVQGGRPYGALSSEDVYPALVAAAQTGFTKVLGPVPDADLNVSATSNTTAAPASLQGAVRSDGLAVTVLPVVTKDTSEKVVDLFH